MDGKVLKNKLGIHTQAALDDAETHLFSDAYEYFFDLLAQGRMRFGPKTLFEIHQYFLSPLYTWAGKVRTVDIAKNGMQFAALAHLPTSLKEFEASFKLNTPKDSDTKRQMAKKVAFLHSELNAIHPFREGNGRTIRLFLDLLVVNSGYYPIDWAKKTQDEYIHACIKGMSKQYLPMERIVYAGLSRKPKS